MQMQQQAIDRVREMQKKATVSETEKPKPRFFVEDETDDAVFLKTDEVKNEPKIKKEPPKRSERPHDEKPNVQKNQRKANPLSFLLGNDSDMSIILPLLLLLGKEGADSTFLLALLYIIL